MALGFQALSEEAIPVADAAGITLAKEENASLCLLQIVDLSRLDDSIYLFLRDKEIERAKALCPMYSSVWVIFLRIGKGTPPELEGAEAFFGQSPYVIYWHVNPEDREFFVPSGQPDDVMGLKKAIINAFEEPSLPYEKPETQKAPANYVRVRAPVCTYFMAATNIIVMLLMFHQGYALMPVIVAARFGAIVPQLIWEYGEYYRLLTAMFVHFGWTHLFFNVAGMFIFGTRIERYYGSGAFLAIYFVSGLSASVASLLLTQGFSAGASGAVYGLLGAAFVYTAYTKRLMDVINNHITLIYIIMGLGMGFIMPNIDYFGHIGGLLAGILLGYIMLKILKIPRGSSGEKLN